MQKTSQNNLRIKRRYLVWMKEAKGLSEKSIDKAASSISTYEAFLKGRGFRAFNVELVRSFKRQLSSKKNKNTGAKISQATVNGVLRDLRAFFLFLADQPGYKSKLTHSEAAYFSTELKSERATRGGLWKPHPSPQQARHVLAQMPADTVIQRRDRALMSFLCLTGSREGAAITIRLQHVDLKTGCVHFDGRSVDTKFSKSFTTSFFPFGGDAENILSDWIGELQNQNLFGRSDPLFPKTKVGLGPERKFAAIGVAREPWSSPSAAAKIFKKAFTEAGFPPFNPHLVRNMIMELANDYCRTPEEFKAWSQNIGHEDVLMSFRSYGSVATGRQMDLFAKFREEGAKT